MRGGLRLHLLVASLVSVLSGCSVAGDFGAVVEGNVRFRRGDLEAAAASYLSVRRPSLAPVVDYDLANTWAVLGETKAADELYSKAARGGEKRLGGDAWYNLGLLRLEGGRWGEAWAAFREALRIDPRDDAARRGLEIAWRAWKKEKTAVPPRPAPASGASFGGVSQDLRLLRRLETGVWRPGSGPSQSGGGNDW